MSDAVLRAEQDHLDESRAALARMRAHTGSLTASGGDHVSLQYVRQALHRRMQSLEDDPEVPLFFGRLDYRTAMGAEHDERLHIGRRHVTGEVGGQPLVIDWRAAMSLPFYRARPGDAMGVERRRRYGFSHGRITAFEDEDLTAGDASFGSELLEAEIEKPRTGPMRDIVATIQPEQDVLVRADLEQSLCIQGAPGTGKTAVGLHRAAFLLYAFRERLGRQGVLVVGPNESFLDYIGDVLPALGEIDATQDTVQTLVQTATGLQVTGTDPAATAVLKGDPRLARVVRNAVWSHLGTPTEALVVPRGSRQLRMAPWQQTEAIEALLQRGVRWEAGREMLPQRLAHVLVMKLEAAGETVDDRTQSAVARSAPVKRAVKALWPALDPVTLVHRLLTDREFLAAAAEDLLSPEEQDLLRPVKAARSARSMTWTVADLALIDEAADLMHRTPSLGHVIVDEAQDLSAMQLRAIGRRASTGSVTVLGDLAQATTPWALTDWSQTLEHLGQQAEIEELVAGFRVPAAVIDYAARLLPTIAPGLRAPHSIRRGSGTLQFGSDLTPAVVAAAGHEGTIGVIAADAAIDALAAELTAAGIDHGILGVRPDRVELVPASLAKGLEFDHVVLVEPAAIVAAEPDRRTGLRRLYVCLTRAVSGLTVVHTEALPPELGTPA